ncbi:MAG: hypothetical protein ABJB12_17345 [Pseudomonadota bacterium]
MNNRSRITDSDPHLSVPLNDGESHVRERVPTAPPMTRKSVPSSSLDERLATKLATAAALLAKLEPQDARARLLHIAMLRRDEALLDGVLAELALPARSTRPSR